MPEIVAPKGPHTDEMLKAICSAGDRCSCADKNYQWHDHTCAVAISHVNAISRRLFGTIGSVSPQDDRTSHAGD